MREKKRNCILIVEDDPDIVNLAEKFLKLGDFETLTCANGRDALEIIEEKYDEIALVLLDIMMPGTSGYSVLQKIKEDERFKDILVILFTAKNFSEEIQKGKKLLLSLHK